MMLVRSLELEDLTGTGQDEVTSSVPVTSQVSFDPQNTADSAVTSATSVAMTSALDDAETALRVPRQDGFFSAPLRENLLIILSGQYGLLIVVVGAVLPVVETFANPSSYMFEGFYIFLYLVSICFLTYVYAYLLRRQARFLPGVKRVFSSVRFSVRRTVSSASSRAGSGRSDCGAAPHGTGAARGKPRRRKVTYSEKPNTHTGSFYLRVGAVGFGIGSMIHSGLTSGHYLEMFHLARASCSGVVPTVKSLLHLLFAFVQMYFIFMNSKMCINRHKTLARFGLMHMAATNVCVWLRAIVVETLHEIHLATRNPSTPSSTLRPPVPRPPANLTHLYMRAGTSQPEKGLLPELQCQWDALMGRVLEKSGSYLYPCIIEYSLICASVLYVMWKQVGHDPRRQQNAVRHEDSLLLLQAPGDTAEEEGAVAAQHKMSVDCGGSQRGLFLGLFVLVTGIVMLVAFYVLASSPASLPAAYLLSHVCESLIYILALTATLAASWQMKNMRFSHDVPVGVEQILAIISLTGLIAFAMFNIVAAIFSSADSAMAVTLMSNVLMTVQGCVQGLFMLAGMRLSPAQGSDVRRKPGRQWVTFLLVCNFALWVLNTFETQRMEHNLLQVQFYGSTAWNIFCHVSVPLGIYYRFHSTVCLSNIWKNAWKVRRCRQG